MRRFSRQAIHDDAKQPESKGGRFFCLGVVEFNAELLQIYLLEVFDFFISRVGNTRVGIVGV